MAEISPANTTRLAQLFRHYGHRTQFSRGKILFLKNDEATEIYYLEKGRVRAYLLYPDGAERTLCYIEHGNLIGEEVFALPPKRIVCADAVTDIRVIAMSGAVLREHCHVDRILLQELMALYMQKIELLSNWIFYGQFSHNDARLACFLYGQSEQRTRIIFTQEQIAIVTGMSRVSVSKLIHRFEEQSLIECGYGWIRVIRRDALKDYFYGQEF